jgi:DNA-binding NtrC family response regulator
LLLDWAISPKSRKDVTTHAQMHILIADRNPHVRNFLKRELEAEGHHVRLAENGGELIRWAFRPEPLDVVILDPDLPNTDAARLLEKLKDRIPPLPVVIHTFGVDYQESANCGKADAFVEKGGNSVESLKKIISTLKPGKRPGRS